MKPKEIILGICGGIAAYKVPELIRVLRKQEFNVRCVLTEHAERFVTTLTLQTLSNNKVHKGMFEDEAWDTEHISLAQLADIIVVVPATADTIAKLSAGRAEDLLSSIILATTAPVLVCPAMNNRMWLHKATQSNVEKLKSYNYHFVEPQEGELACGVTGIGRLASTDDIVKSIIGLIKVHCIVV